MVTQSDKTNTGVVATIVVVGAFAMISISALLTAMVRSAETDMDAVRPMHADLDTIAGLKQQQTAALHAAPHWVDKSAGKMGIPIEQAMKLVLADVRRDPSAASPPIPPGLVLPPAPPAEGAAGALAVPGASPGAGAPGATPASGAPPASAPGAVPAPVAPGAPAAVPAGAVPPHAGATASGAPAGSVPAPPTPTVQTPRQP